MLVKVLVPEIVFEGFELGLCVMFEVIGHQVFKAEMRVGFESLSYSQLRSTSETEFYRAIATLFPLGHEL
ncbi:hypothetical protein PHISP_08005 [Aspergillus sp. HF37]|nr:hypothetical protein PHISP_08005 [Aspergillus sp. HF37]